MSAGVGSSPESEFPPIPGPRPAVAAEAQRRVKGPAPARVPISDVERQKAGNMPRVDPGLGSKILVVDDEPQLLKLMVRVLERAGHRVVSAADGNEALDAFGRDPAGFDALVLDVGMPPRGAAGVLEAVSPQRDDLALVLCSGDALEDPLRDTLRARRGTFLRKPFVPQALLRAVTQVLPQGERA